MQVVLLPVLVGAGLNGAFPRAVSAFAPLSAVSAVALIALIVGSVMAANAAAALTAGPQLLAAVAILHAGGAGRGCIGSVCGGIRVPIGSVWGGVRVPTPHGAAGAVVVSARLPPSSHMRPPSSSHC